MLTASTSARFMSVRWFAGWRMLLQMLKRVLLVAAASSMVQVGILGQATEYSQQLRMAWVSVLHAPAHAVTTALLKTLGQIGGRCKLIRSLVLSAVLLITFYLQTPPSLQRPDYCPRAPAYKQNWPMKQHSQALLG